MATIADPLTSALVEARYLESLAQSLQQRVSLVEAAIAEIQVASSTVGGLSKEVAGADILVPIGGGSYIRAKVVDVEKLIVGVGADVAVERSAKEATESYQARIDELRKARSSLEEELERVAANIARARQELQRLTRKQTEGK
jgi:prefoldin alpha subunit